MGDQNLDFQATWNAVLPVIKQLFPQLINAKSRDIQNLLNNTIESSKVSHEDRELAKDYLIEAFIDIRCCRLLRGKRIYSRAIYFLQQAIEKTAKAWALDYGVLNRKEVRRTMHRTPMIFLKMLKKEGLEQWLSLIKQIAPDMCTDISNAEQILSKGSHPGIAKMPKPRIEGYLSSINTLDEVANSINAAMPSLAELLGQKPIISPIGQYVNVGLSVLFLGLIAFPHESFTRYPDGDIAFGELVPRNYDSNIGIVASISKMDKCLTSKMKLLNNLLEERKA